MMEITRRPSRAGTGRIGVSATALAVEKEFGWLLREQPTEDYGIDAHVELVEDDHVEGKLLALQIKSGASWFREEGPGGWWFRPDSRHVEYWRNHSLPVVVVMYHPATERCYWQVVSDETLVSTTGGGWKVLIPEAHVLDAAAREPLRKAAEGDPYVIRIRELQLARPRINRLVDGDRLVIDIEEWINKSSGRGAITFGIDNEDGNDPSVLATWSVFLGSASYAEAVPSLFPWADVHVHAETYAEAEYEEYEAECVIYDSEGDKFTTADFGEWRAGRERQGLRPYAEAAGEVEYWRLELTLNDLGRAFRLVDLFASQRDASDQT